MLQCSRLYFFLYSRPLGYYLYLGPLVKGVQNCEKEADLFNLHNTESVLIHSREDTFINKVWEYNTLSF
jgi:hypothetical protein